MESVYDAKAQGIKLWELSPAYPAPGAIAILWRLSLDDERPGPKENDPGSRRPDGEQGAGKRRSEGSD